MGEYGCAQSCFFLFCPNVKSAISNKILIGVQADIAVSKRKTVSIQVNLIMTGDIVFLFQSSLITNGFDVMALLEF